MIHCRPPSPEAAPSPRPASNGASPKYNTCTTRRRTGHSVRSPTTQRRASAAFPVNYSGPPSPASTLEGTYVPDGYPALGLCDAGNITFPRRRSPVICFAQKLSFFHSQTVSAKKGGGGGEKPFHELKFYPRSPRSGLGTCLPLRMGAQPQGPLPNRDCAFGQFADFSCRPSYDDSCPRVLVHSFIPTAPASLRFILNFRVPLCVMSIVPLLSSLDITILYNLSPVLPVLRPLP